MLNWYPFLTYVVVTNFTPGPNNVMAMTSAVGKGLKGTLGFLLGVAAGFFVMMLACGLVNISLVSILPRAGYWLNILGAVYMAFLALQILLSKMTNGERSSNSTGRFRTGFIMQFLNLKVILYGITVYSTFIVQRYHSPVVIGLFAAVLAMVGFVAVFTWASGGSMFRGYLARHYVWFKIAMAALLVYSAIASLSNG